MKLQGNTENITSGSLMFSIRRDRLAGDIKEGQVWESILYPDQVGGKIVTPAHRSDT